MTTTVPVRTTGTTELPLSIGGAHRAAASGRTYTPVDPFTQQPWARVPDAGAQDVDDAVVAARAALDGPWGQLTADQRGKLLFRLADLHRAHRMAARLRAGTVWVNAYRVVGPHVPFGGSGSSGIGRENGVEALKDYTETKSVWVELTGATRDPFTLG